MVNNQKVFLNINFTIDQYYTKVYSKKILYKRLIFNCHLFPKNEMVSIVCMYFFFKLLIVRCLIIKQKKNKFYPMSVTKLIRRFLNPGTNCAQA